MRLKKIILSIIIISGLVSCSNEIELIDNYTSDVERVCVSVADFEWEDNQDTRTTAVSNGSNVNFMWGVNDTIGIIPNEGDQVAFPLESGAGTGTAVFDGGGWALKSQSTYAAYYPYTDKLYRIAMAIGTHIPVDYSEQIQVGNDNLDNLTKCDYLVSSISTPQNGEVSFLFKHMGSLARFVLTVPETSNFTKFTLSCDDEVFPARRYVNIKSDPIRITNSFMGKTISMSLNNISANSGSTITLYMILPAVDLSGRTLTATLSDTSAEYSATIMAKNYVSGMAYNYVANLEKAPNTRLYSDWTSTNKTDSSVSDYMCTIDIIQGQTLSFDWSVRSEDNYDWLIVSLDGSEILKKSGNHSGHYSKKFAGSGTVTFDAKYVKDDSQSKWSDEVRIYNIKVTGGQSVSSTVHEYVDLGLPSGTLWATCNIGAENPEDYGEYFAWGETVGGKTSYDVSNYNWGTGVSYGMIKYTYPDGRKDGIWYSGSTFVGDNKTELDPEDDAAYVNWGSEWRMPTRAQWEELYNSSYTTTTWTTLNGVDGIKISKKSDDSVYIFLPAAGCRSFSSLNDACSRGYYWSRSLNTNYSNQAHYLDSDYIGWVMTSGRNYGYSVRPVYAK